MAGDEARALGAGHEAHAIRLAGRQVPHARRVIQRGVLQHLDLWLDGQPTRFPFQEEGHLRKKVTSGCRSRARFDALVAHGWSIDALDELAPLSEATLACVEDLAALEVSATGAQLSAEVKEEAPALRARMMKVLRYWLADDTETIAQLDDIRSGTGYRDLARDLGRLAELYKAHAAMLANDTHLYAAADTERARALSNAILGAIAVTKEDQRVIKQDQLRRLFALLDARYAEVRAAGRFLLRDADGDARFPGVRVLSR